MACGAAGRDPARPTRAERRDARAGNLAGLALSPLLLAALGWRSLFYVFGAVGAPLLALWLAVVPARPTRARLVPAPGRARVGVLDLLRSRATWAIIVRRPAVPANPPLMLLQRTQPSRTRACRWIYNQTVHDASCGPARAVNDVHGRARGSGAAAHKARRTPPAPPKRTFVTWPGGQRRQPLGLLHLPVLMLSYIG